MRQNMDRQRFEHKAISFGLFKVGQDNGIRSDFDTKIAAAERYGWELVSVGPSYESTQTAIAYLKRPMCHSAPRVEMHLTARDNAPNWPSGRQATRGAGGTDAKIVPVAEVFTRFPRTVDGQQRDERRRSNLQASLDVVGEGRSKIAFETRTCTCGEGGQVGYMRNVCTCPAELTGPCHCATTRGSLDRGAGDEFGGMARHSGDSAKLEPVASSGWTGLGSGD